MHSDRRRRNERKDPERKEAGSKLGYLCTQVWLITRRRAFGRVGKGDEGRLRADWVLHPEGRMGEEGGVRLSFLTAPKVKVDFTFRP